MPVGRSGIAVGQFIIPAGILLVCVAPFLIYRATAGNAPSWLIGAAVVVQITVIVCLLTRSLAIWCRVILAVAAMAVVAAAALVPGLPMRSAGFAVGGIWHAAAYSSLLIWFARSLRPDRESVVTGFARRIRRTMPVEVVRYTRRVTIAWCVFFAAQLSMSAALLAVAPEAIWPAFVTLLNLPLIVAMILAESGCRLLVFRGEPHTGLIATLAGLRHIRGMPGGQS
jgi:uncharacterized membrane protein